MTSKEPSKPTELTQELRLATTMTGGVSLAVWMAGVAREINLLAQASQWRRVGGNFPAGGQLSKQSKASLKLYAALIELLDIVVDVDILSGTSAGGINAALLASSRVTGSDLGGLRDLWLDLGALTDLLRDPTDKSTPSLLYGDERMFAVLAEQLPKLAKGPFPPAEFPEGPRTPSTTLYVTTTLLTGETSRFTDSFGTLVQDVDRRGLFTFTETQLASEDTYSALALAARSSASFPLAFEPSFVPFSEGTPAKGDVPARPAMDAFANTTRPHWVADGGLLDNQPIDVLLQRVFDRPARRPVRRVLLFVVPSSGPAPDLTKHGPTDDVDQPLGLVDGLLKDLSAVTTQSIAAELRTIRAHQDRMESRTNTRLRLAELASRLRSRLLTPALLADYRTHEATKQAHTLTAALLRQLSTWPPASSRSTESIPKHWEKELAIGGDAEKVCRRTIKESILRGWSHPSGKPLPENVEDLAQYGQPALELAKASALTVVQAAYQLAKSEDVTTALAGLTRRIHETSEPPEQSNGRAEKPPAPPDIGKLVRTVCTEAREKSLAGAAEQLAKAYLKQCGIREEAWKELGRVLNELGRIRQKKYKTNNYETLRELATRASSDPDAPTDSLRAQDRDAASALHAYLKYFVATESEQATARKLFDLAATQRAMLPAEADIEQSLELVQVSADTRSLLAPNFQTAQQKLTGMQFHHFGAFYKRSWRANDWMWGRLDGAGWLIHVLLDPRRVRWIVDRERERSTTRIKSGAEWFLSKLEDLGAPDLPGSGDPQSVGDDESDLYPTRNTLRKELAFLDNSSLPIPSSIPRTSLWLAQVWQQRVLDEELNGLANAVRDPQPGKTPDWSPTSSQTWAEQVLAPSPQDAKYPLLKTNPVARETFATDKGSPLMAHTITKAAATASAAAGSVRQLPGVLKPPLITVQTLALGGYRVVSLTKGVARSSIKFGAALLVLGVAFAIQSVALVGVTGLALAGTGAYLVVLGTWQSSSKPGTLRPESKPESRWHLIWSRIRKGLSRPRTWWRNSRIRQRLSESRIWRWLSRPLLPLLSVTVVGAVLSLATPVVRRWLFGTDQHPGLVGNHTYWLGAEWWHPLIVVAAIALAFAITAIAAARPGRK